MAEVGSTLRYYGTKRTDVRLQQISLGIFLPVLVLFVWMVTLETQRAVHTPPQLLPHAAEYALFALVGIPSWGLRGDIWWQE